MEPSSSDRLSTIPLMDHANQHTQTQTHMEHTPVSVDRAYTMDWTPHAANKKIHDDDKQQQQ